MNDIVLQYINKMLRFERSGHIVEALTLSNKLLETFPENKSEILLEKAKMEFRNGYEKEALLAFISVYEIESSIELYELILEAYYVPNKKLLRQIFDENMEYLHVYHGYKNNSEGNERKNIPIWEDEEVIVSVCLEKKEFFVYKQYVEETKEGRSAIAINQWGRICDFGQKSNFHISYIYMDEELPTYWVFDKNYWSLQAQLYDLKSLIKDNDIVFFDGGNINADEVIKVCKKGMRLFPQYKNEIEFEIAKVNYNDGKQEVLIQLMELYGKTKNYEIIDFILNVYYKSRKKEMDERYHKNCSLLEKYDYFFGTINPTRRRFYPIWVEEARIWYYDSLEESFKIWDHYRVIMKEPMDEVYIASDLLWLEDILLLEKMTRKIDPFMDLENPLLLIYKEETWELLLQLLDLRRLIDFDRIVFYNNLMELESSLLEKGILFPQMAMGNLSDNVKEVLCHAYQKCIDQFMKYQKEALRYYGENSDEVIEHIKEGKPKILFKTSRFTTALQYHIRDCKIEMEKMGLETEVIIEKDRLNTGASSLLYIKKIAEFRPDIIFTLDHFRYERGWMHDLDGVVWVCWIQDTLSHIFSKETPLKQKERDVVISIFYNWKVFRELGYREDRLLPAPMVASHRIYHPYKLNKEEKVQYECDVCMVCHASNAELYMETFIKQFNEESKGYIKDLYLSYINYVRDTDHIFVSLDELRCFIEKFMGKFYGIGFNSDSLEYIAEDMRTSLNTRLYREMLADWLIEAGYENIKLWGKEWNENEKYKPYAMGAAENGETLSKILQASKIVIGNNLVLSGASRVAETLLSGAFYMANYIPTEYDTCDIRQWLKEGEEVVFFYDKADFLHKVKFFLEHKEERQRMAKIGREKALEKLTYEKFMKNTIKEIGNMF